MESKGSLQEISSTIVDLEELLSRISEFIVHLLQICEFSKVIGSQLHLASLFSLVYSFAENGSGIPMQKLVELDSYQIVSRDQISYVGYFEAYITTGQKLLSNVFDYSIQGQFC